MVYELLVFTACGVVSLDWFAGWWLAWLTCGGYHGLMTRRVQIDYGSARVVSNHRQRENPLLSSKHIVTKDPTLRTVITLHFEYDRICCARVLTYNYYYGTRHAWPENSPQLNWT